MKQWISALGYGSCASDFSHRWQAGERIVRVSGRDGGWAKDYCGPCGQRLFGIGEDPGEQPTVEPPRAQGQPAMTSVSEIAEQFDPKRAAANDRE